MPTGSKGARRTVPDKRPPAAVVAQRLRAGQAALQFCTSSTLASFATC